MSQLIDRRLNSKNKSVLNRQRFIRRYKQQIKKAVSDAIANRSVTDFESGEKISIPVKDISEPNFGHGRGGVRESVYTGNQDFTAGDRIPRPLGGGQGAGGKASNQGEGTDDFAFELSKEEFLNFFFEDLELPDLVKKNLATIEEYKMVRAGYTTAGVPSNINVIRSLRGALARRIAVSSPYLARLHEAEDQLEQLLKTRSDQDPAVLGLLDEIEALKAKIRAVPFIDTFDLRYNNRVKRATPSTQAVMFCLMDVSGSMTQQKKDMAKRFFMLLYLFLSRSYEKTTLVFIRHHTVAKEVDEEDFFYSRETGGTVVSSALQLAHDIIVDRFPTSDWNIYFAQASDGDNWDNDSPKCSDILMSRLMPLAQYYAYIEIGENNQVGSLWREYLRVKEAFPQFTMQHIDEPADIYPVFRKLFSRKAA